MYDRNNYKLFFDFKRYRARLWKAFLKQKISFKELARKSFLKKDYVRELFVNHDAFPEYFEMEAIAQCLNKPMEYFIKDWDNVKKIFIENRHSGDRNAIQ